MKMWHLWSFALILAFASFLMLSGVSAEASTLNVGDYKGERASSEWLVPTEDGKVFAGWYEDAAFTTPYTVTTGQAYAKFVDAKVLTVKKQFRANFQSTDVTTDIRILTGLDSLNYKGVTFHVTVPESNKDWTVTETTAYTSIRAAGTANPILPSDEAAFGTADAQYFAIHSFTGIPAEAFAHPFFVTASWETMDGTKVQGAEQQFTVNEMQLKSSLFTDRLTIGERTEYSAVQNWDITEISNNKLTGVSLTDGQVMWFKSTGKAALFSATVTRKDTSSTMTNRESQPLAALGLSDGTNYGHVGVRAGGIIYNGNWINGKIGRDLWATWSSAANMTANLTVLLWNGQFHVYVDDVYCTSIDESQVISGATADTELAFSLVMSAYGKNAEFEYSSIRFCADYEEIRAFLLASKGFATNVTVNNLELESALDNWDVSGILDGNVRTATALSGSMQPLYFLETGKQAYLHMTATVTSDTANAPLAGIWMHDGSKRGFIGVRSNGVMARKQGANWDWWLTSGDYWGGTYLAPAWGAPKTVDIDILIQNGTITIAIGNKTWSGPLSDIMPEATGKDLAFGLVMFHEGSYNTDMTFSNVQFATDPDEIKALSLSRIGLTSSVTVNGKTTNSALDKWDISNAFGGSVRIARASGEASVNNQPIYFAKTGTTALVHFKATVTSTTPGDPMAGIAMSNGEKWAFLGVRGSGVLYNNLGAGWNAWASDNAWSYSTLTPTWGGNATATVDFVVKDGKAYIYLDNQPGFTYNLSNLNIASGTNLAFGLITYTDGSSIDMTFSDLSITTDSAAVDAFLASKTQ